MKRFVNTLQAIWAISSQPMLVLMSIPAGLLQGVYTRAMGGKYRSALEWKIVNTLTDAIGWGLLLYVNFRIRWHPWFFTMAMASACILQIVQQKWRREAGVQTGLEEWQQVGLPVEVGGITGREQTARFVVDSAQEFDRILAMWEQGNDAERPVHVQRTTRRLVIKHARGDVAIYEVAKPQ